MKKISIAAAAVVLLLMPFSCGRRGSSAKEAEPQKDTVYPLGFLTDTLRLESSKVRQGDTFAALMLRLGLAKEKLYPLSLACGDSFDVRLIRTDRPIDAYYSGDTLAPRLDYVVYKNDRINSTVFRCFDSLAVWRVSKQVDTVRKYVDVTIHSSLWQDLVNQGESPIFISTFESVYEWTVNFFGLHEGDRFQAIARERVCEGEVFDVLGIDFAVYSRGADSLYAIRFDQGDGGNKYWNQKGESMRKAFLKAPLKFSRISSHFTYHRKHPIYGTVRPHTGVDYAAPAGTPVHALGDGTVTKVGWDSHGGGNTIKIRHANRYETGYLHLKGYAKGIRPGVLVEQGQVIGYVGATGAATGPHLDFRVWKNGTPIDPLKMESPSAEPIKPENKPALDSLFAAYKAEVKKLSK